MITMALSGVPSHSWSRLGFIHGGRRLAKAGLGLVVASASGCMTVQPYARGRLAQPDMVLERPAELVAGQEHADEYREASVGGLGGSGGGCGCN